MLKEKSAQKRGDQCILIKFGGVQNSGCHEGPARMEPCDDRTDLSHLWRSRMRRKNRPSTSMTHLDATDGQIRHIRDSQVWRSDRSVTPVTDLPQYRSEERSVSLRPSVKLFGSSWNFLPMSEFFFPSSIFKSLICCHCLFFFFFPVVEGRRYLTVIVLHNEQIHVRSRRNCRPSPLPALTPSCGCDVPKVRCFKSVVQMNHPSYGKTASDGSRITHPQETPTPSSDKSF